MEREAREKVREHVSSSPGLYIYMCESESESKRKAREGGSAKARSHEAESYDTLSTLFRPGGRASFVPRYASCH